MKLQYLSLLLLSIIIHAADQAKIITFTTPALLSAANPDRETPDLVHHINLASRETHTKKTFQELYDNARNNNLPWIVSVCLITLNHKSSVEYITEYLDTIALLHRYNPTCDFFSQDSTSNVVTNLPLKFIEDHYLNSVATSYEQCYFYHEKKDALPKQIRTNNRYSVSVTGKKTIIISDMSCALSIALLNNHSQLWPIREILNNKITDHSASQLAWKRVWNKLHATLPNETKAALEQIFVDRYGK